MMVDIKKVTELVKSTANIINNMEIRQAITIKGPADFVTMVDTEVQKYLRNRLLELYPDIQFMGEEGEKNSIDFHGSVWILDPIDGTTNLIYSYPAYAVSLGMVENGESVLGVVFLPSSGEIFYAQKGKGAYLNGKRIRVSDTALLSDSLMGIGTSPYDKEKLADINFKLIHNLFIKCNDIRRSGSAAFDLCCVACGRIDGFIERNLKPWDYAAGCAILKEAGGKITSMNGGRVTFDKNCDILASNGKNYNEIADVIKESCKD
jgi:myo-inositol-1(or 4)-monophosphatase